MRGTGAFRVIWINLALLAAGLLVVELVFGGWLRHDELYRLDPLRDVVLHYDVDGLYPTAQPRITYSRDKYGLRGNYGVDPAAIDILTVGGSTTDQRYITDGQTWQDVLQKRFADAGHRVLVANAGIDGQSTVGHIDAFDWWFPSIPRLRPRFVLYYVGLNDFYINGGNVDAPTGYRRALRRIEDRSALAHLVRRIRGVYLAEFVFGIGHRHVDFGAIRWTRDAVQPDYHFADARVAAFGSRVRILIDRTRRFGAEPIFVTQPSRYYRRTPSGVEGRSELSTFAGWSINGVDAYRIMRRLDDAMADASVTGRAHCVDLDAQSRWDDGDFYDFQHMTPAGIAKLGGYFFDDLRATVVNPAKAPW